MTKSEEIMKAHRAQSMLNFPGKLDDGQQAIWLTPAFEARDPDGRKDYGIGGVNLTFAKRKGDRIMDITFLTDWYPIDVQKRSMHDYRRIDVIGEQPLCQGLYRHELNKPKETEYMHESDDCLLTGGKCWGEVGSALYGDTIRERLINEGSVGVWDEIDKALEEDW